MGILDNAKGICYNAVGEWKYRIADSHEKGARARSFFYAFVVWLSIKPFADIVGNYTCYDRQYEWKHQRKFTSFLRMHEVTTWLLYHRLVDYLVLEKKSRIFSLILSMIENHLNQINQKRFFWLSLAEPTEYARYFDMKCQNTDCVTSWQEVTRTIQLYTRLYSENKEW